MAPRRYLPAILISLLLSSISVEAASASDCNCFRTSGGSSPAFYRHHHFQDFRSVDAPPLPASIQPDQDNGAEAATSDYFTGSTFKDKFTIQAWKKEAKGDSPIARVNSLQNVYISRDAGASTSHMTLRTERLKDFQSVAEIETNTDTILHASIRVRMRVAGDGGAVAGVFLYSNDNNESDLEVLTRDPSEDFRATNQPALDLKGQVIEDATNTIPIPAADNDQNGKTVKALGSSVTTNTTAVVNGTRGDWNEYRLDWLPGSSEWIVNGHLVDSKTYGVPTGHCHLAINLWSNGGSWSGNMSVGGQAHMDIEWIEMAYNVTGEEGSHCDILCGVDETGSDIGSPKFISGAARSRPMAGSGILWSLAILVAGWSFA